MEQSVAAMSAISGRINEAWDNGDAVAFAADFAVDAEFVAFDGTVLRGRDEIVAFHEPLFATVLKGSRVVDGDVVFARIVGPGFGVVHHRLSVILPGEETPSASRDSMQLLAVVWQNDRWEVAASQNCRVISLETQLVLDGIG